jgi:hypothetical protein
MKRAAGERETERERERCRTRHVGSITYVQASNSVHEGSFPSIKNVNTYTDFVANTIGQWFLFSVISDIYRPLGIVNGLHIHSLISQNKTASCSPLFQTYIGL